MYIMNEIDNLIEKMTQPSNESSIRANLRTFTEDKKKVKVFLSELYAVLNQLPTEQLGKIAHIIDDAKLKGGRKSKTKRRKSKTKRRKSKTKRTKRTKKTRTIKRIIGGNYDSNSEDDTASNNSQDDMECGICLDTFETILPNEDMTKISHGQGETPHYFHKYCLKRYFQVSRNTSCPSCRTQFPINQLVDLGINEQIPIQQEQGRNGYLLQIMSFVAVAITILASTNTRGTREMMETAVVLVGTLYQIFKALLEILSIYLRENTVINQTQLVAIIAFITIVFLRRSQR